MVSFRQRSSASRIAGALAIALLAPSAHAQTRFADFPSDSDRVLLMRVIAAEDARGRGPRDMLVLQSALSSRNPALRRFAVRSVGRFERGSLAYLITPLLRDANATVRSAAAAALAQATSHDNAAVARAALLERLPIETNDSARAELAESLGRLKPDDSTQVSQSLDALYRASRSASAVTLRGVVRGLFFLSRRPRTSSAFSMVGLRRLQELTTYGRSSTDSSAGYIRMVAAMTLVGARNALLSDIEVLQADPVPAVREQGVVAAASMQDTAIVRTIVSRALRDSAPVVRFRALAVYERKLRPTDGCAPVMAAARDTNTSVALAAIDALAQCGDFVSARLLDTIASSPAEGGSWHRSAHAFVALAAADPIAARRHFRRFLADTNFFVRTYVARAAARLRDTVTLIRLTVSAEHPNVRAEAIDGLVAVGGPRDSIYIAALSSDASQLLQSAARALSGSQNPTAQNSLVGALERVTVLNRETERDARVAILDAIKTQGQRAPPDRLRPFLTDYDSVVAVKAADVIAEWTGQRPTIAPRPLPPVPLPTIADLQQIETANGEIVMANGDRVALRFFPLDAPTNAWRFARQARSGYFDGLTFHRVVPWFVVQGGSPAANEYMGDARFTRDELAIENRRGTIGLSTRGRDTGDGQIYFNLIDNVRLDHDYTVWGEVTSALDAVDRMQEGARIRTVVIR